MSNSENAKLVVIDVYETSDDAMEQLGGWNFNINPYTLEPVGYEPLSDKT